MRPMEASIPRRDYDPKTKKRPADKPIPPGVYPVIDSDLARDNLENDLPAADLSEL